MVFFLLPNYFTQNKIDRMKQLLLPVILICFAICCLGFVHIDNMNKLEKETSEIEHTNTKTIA